MKPPEEIVVGVCPRCRALGPAERPSRKGLLLALCSQCPCAVVPALVRYRLVVAGRCSVCGCTDREPCDMPCGWANAEHTLCTNCVPAPRARRPLRAAKIAGRRGAA
ncbi:MAG TPA: hypothetical protein VMI75_03525 [Polyangiaceae bacterium]|nr:hypothetical protein [Polyangiaceae bacterium]